MNHSFGNIDITAPFLNSLPIESCQHITLTAIIKRYLTNSLLYNISGIIGIHNHFPQ